MEILTVDNIRKRFGEVLAVDGVSFGVSEGTIYGLLGPNGAGKSTTIRMITDIIKPDSGTITFAGGAKFGDSTGYMPEERGLYKKIKVIDQLVYFAQLKGMKKADAQREAREWLRKFDASDWEKKKIQELSKGMQQKVQFISTILHNPRLLILDEPFSGFDPINADMLKKYIIAMKERGTTILLSTHIMEQAEQMCDGICLFNKGRKMLEGNIRDIKHSYGRNTVIIEFAGSDTWLEKFPGLQFINRTRSHVEFKIPDNAYQTRDILAAVADSAELIKFELAEPSLHEIFVDVVSKEPVDNGGNNG